ncbi:MAG TPA: glutaredoxin domain-containing protein [Gaiellaceae bacterium]|nr:glutaredoxin domain-containing protein [Gaiellaceae bacterium]
MELWQTEWCPASRRVRQRLTELGVDYVVRQVPVEREERTALLEAVGVDTIPVLVLDDGTVVVGEDAIGARLDAVAEPAGAEAHRAKAAKARRRYLEEECECPQQPATPSPRPRRSRTPKPSSASARS